MKKLFLICLITLGLGLCSAQALGVAASPTNSFAWTGAFNASSFSNVVYNVVVTTPSVTAAQLGTNSIPNTNVVGVLGAFQTAGTTIPISTLLPTGTSTNGDYSIWAETVGQINGSTIISSWNSLSIIYTGLTLGPPTNLTIQ